MPTCSVYRCSNRTGKLKVNQDQKKIHFHRFPQDLNIRLLWIKALRRVDWLPTKGSSVCSDHFLPDDYLYHESCIAKLRPNVVPSVFKSYPAYLQKKLKTRKPPKERNAPQVVNFQIADIPIANTANDEDPIVDDRSFLICEPNSSSNDAMICERSTSSNNAMICEPNKQNIEKTTSPFRKASNSISPIKARLINECFKKQQQIKKLQQEKIRQTEEITSLKNVISTIKQKFSSTNETIHGADILAEGKQDLLRRQLSKKKKSFAITLNYYSTSALL